VLPEQSAVHKQAVPTMAQLSLKQGQSCPDSLASIFRDQTDAVKQFAGWMEFCKALDLKVPSKSQ